MKILGDFNNLWPFNHLSFLKNHAPGVACSRLQEEMTNETVALKAKYKDVKSVGAFTPKALTEGERCLRVCCAVEKHWMLAAEHCGLSTKKKLADLGIESKELGSKELGSFFN